MLKISGFDAPASDSSVGHLAVFPSGKIISLSQAVGYETNLQSSCRVVPSSARVLPRLDAFGPLLDHLKNLICYLFWVRIQRYHRRQH